MSFNRTIIIILIVNLAGLLPLNGQVAQNAEECTIGVAAGKATSDGRPMIWKTRDNSSEPDNELVFNTSFPVHFLEVINAGETYAWMGVNERGFAILNSVANDLTSGSSGLSNGSLMREALGTCISVDELQTLLDHTNSSGRITRGNFAVLDLSGAAAIFEIDGDEYWKYDANDSVTTQTGFIVRTNFAENGDGVSGSGYERFYRSSELINSFYDGDSLNYRSIIRHQMRDFSDFDSNPVPVPFAAEWMAGRPFGYIYTGVSICRSSSVSTTVIQGVLGNEPYELTTMWTLLGHPAATVAIPYWPVGSTPVQANGNPTSALCDIALQIKSKLFDYSENLNYINSFLLKNDDHNGLWRKTFSIEDSIFNSAEEQLTIWRGQLPGNQDILNFENSLARYGLESLENIYAEMNTTGIADVNKTVRLFEMRQNFPNPFNPSTTIEFSMPSAGFVSIKIYNLIGQEVADVLHEDLSSGMHKVVWNASEYHVASGVYFYRLKISGIKDFSAVKKLTIIK